MIEDRLRATMTAHDSEAPDASRLVVPDAPVQHRGQLAAGIAMVAIIAVVIATFSLHGRTSGHPATIRPPVSSTAAAVPALNCPSAVKSTPDVASPWVPGTPHGVDGAARLAPLATPSRAVVCAFISPGSPAGHSGSAVLTGDLTGVADDLAWAPPTVHGSDTACAAYLAATDGDHYLIGLSYPGGTVWVAAPANHCAGSGNGVFTSPANLSGMAKSWYQAGHWTPDSTQPCLAGPGRLGQQLSMVPAGAISVTACHNDKGAQTRVASDATVRQLIRTLDGKTTKAPSPMCQPTGAAFDDYSLIFKYDVGPAVTVRIQSGCVPEVDNGSLQAQSASDVLPLIEAIIAGR